MEYKTKQSSKSIFSIVRLKEAVIPVLERNNDQETLYLNKNHYVEKYSEKYKAIILEEENEEESDEENEEESDEEYEEENFKKYQLTDILKKCLLFQCSVEELVLLTDWSWYKFNCHQDCDILLQIYQKYITDDKSLIFLLALLLIIAQQDSLIIVPIIEQIDIIQIIESNDLFLPFCRVIIGILEINPDLADLFQNRGWYIFLLNCRNDPYYLLYSAEYIECMAYFTSHLTNIEFQYCDDLYEILEVTLDIFYSRHKYVQAKLVLFLYKMKNIYVRKGSIEIKSKYNNILNCMLEEDISMKIKFFIRYFLLSEK